MKDIRQAKDKLEIKYKRDINFRYVETKDNQADLLTRRLSSRKFLEYLPFWLHGPTWLVDSPNKWPKYDLNSMSAIAKSHVVAHIELHVMPALLDVERFSSFIN